MTTFTPDFVPWTSVVSTSAGILYYSMQTGLGMLGRLDAMGNHTIITYYDHGEFGAGWTHVVSAEGYLFFYNSSDGSAMVVSMGWAVPLYGFSPGWTHIVSTHNGLLFYSSNNGAGAELELVSRCSGCDSLNGKALIRKAREADPIHYC